ncbi:MAG TPA: penicillin-binding transpeptidase domain-containing protein [Solirubrobacteraceae bacterium]|nr:penicillin-binding transpeptidase domain-containing protein [Solirubrobacteraceae bacterium]
MITPSGGPMKDDRIGPMNPQLAVRVAIIGSVALLMFAVIFLRLWFLQVLTGNQYVAQAQTNIVRRVPVAAPRGSILAAGGQVLVDSVKVPAILIQPQELPVPLQATASGLVRQPPRDQVVYDRLARALNLSTRPQKCPFTLTADNGQGTLVTQQFDPLMGEIPCIIAQHAAQITIGNVTIATNIPVAEQAYISERQSLFPGVAVSQVSVSQYPQGQLAAQLLGTVGPLNQAQTHQSQFKGIPPYDNVGQSGLEYQYNQYLQGRDGYQRVEVNALGQFQGETTPVAPSPGYNLRTSINLPLERVGTQALSTSIARIGSQDGGAFIALNPDNGQVYAMGSLPSYDPAIFNKPLTQQRYDALFGKNPQDPLFDRAIQAVGPVGSTFKVISSTAALQSGTWSPNELFDDTGQVCVSGHCFHNAPGDGAQGAINLVQAIEVSDDDFFYHLGALMNVSNPIAQPEGGPLQEWARKFGVDRRPNIDLPYASSGTVPTPALIQAQITAEHQCDTATGPFAYTNGTATSSHPQRGFHRSPTHPPGGCGIADASTLGWTIGDNMLMAIGQGDVQLSPLQLALVYSAIANGGTMVTPHIGQDIQTASGNVVSRLTFAPGRNLHISPSTIQTIQAGLRLAASGPTGTSTDVMRSFPLPVYGKTGTADYIPTTGPYAGVDTAYAWYACFVPASATSKPIAIVVWVEAGGYGDQTAAPVAREMLSQWFFNKPGAFVTGSSTSH